MMSHAKIVQLEPRVLLIYLGLDSNLLHLENAIYLSFTYERIFKVLGIVKKKYIKIGR